MLDLEQLNETQRKAVTYGEGPLLVLAGPGSGKTTVVIQRIFYLLEKMKVPPEKILVLTFTKEAVLSMKSRFLRQAGGTGVNISVNFGTFHSVFYYILRKSPDVQVNKILFSSQKQELLLPIIKKYGQEKEAIGDLLFAISYFKNTGDMEAARGKVALERQESFEYILAEYERERKRTGGMDFDDMVYECGKLLERDKALRSLWQERFDYILLDEFQDINPSQYKVIKLLTKPPHSIFAVGDDDQSIYSFRGADFSCLKRFEEEYHAEKLLLDINYRSRQEIVDASLKVISENKNRYPKRLYSWQGAVRVHSENPVVKIQTFDTQKAQYHYVAEGLKQELKEGSCAVLFRTNMQLQRFAVTMDKYNVPFCVKEKSESLYEHFAVKDIMAYLQLASGEWSRETFFHIMNRPARFISREAVGSGSMPMLQELEKLRKQLIYIGRVPVYLGVQYIRRAVGYDSYLKELSGNRPEKYTEWLEILDWLCEDASGYETFSEWREAQKSYTQGLQNMRQSDDKQAYAVWLMTVHGAKGLEFDRVWIPDCNEGIFPHGNLHSDKEGEEERRIFYVAMTRAKEKLELSCLDGTEKRSRLPSRFLNPLL